MTSPARIEANQRNAQKSTGPRTEEGKRKSSQNSLRHGFTAHQLILDPIEEELFPTFAENITKELNPKTQLELNLVDQIISASWRLRRTARLETDLLRSLQGLKGQSLGERLFQEDQQKRLFALSAHETRLEKGLSRALRELAQVREIVNDRADQEGEQPKQVAWLQGGNEDIARVRETVSHLQRTEDRMIYAKRQIQDINGLKDEIERLLWQHDHLVEEIARLKGAKQNEHIERQLKIARHHLYLNRRKLQIYQDNVTRQRKEKFQKTNPIDELRQTVERELDQAEAKLKQTLAEQPDPNSRQQERPTQSEETKNAKTNPTQSNSKPDRLGIEEDPRWDSIFPQVKEGLRKLKALQCQGHLAQKIADPKQREIEIAASKIGLHKLTSETRFLGAPYEFLQFKPERDLPNQT